MELIKIKIKLIKAKMEPSFSLFSYRFGKFLSYFFTVNESSFRSSLLNIRQPSTKGEKIAVRNASLITSRRARVFPHDGVGATQRSTLFFNLFYFTISFTFIFNIYFYEFARSRSHPELILRMFYTAIFYGVCYSRPFSSLNIGTVITLLIITCI